MSKKKSIALLAVIFAVILVLSFMTFVSFAVPGYKEGIYNFNSILGALDLDADFDESVAYTLTLKDSVSAEDEDVQMKSIMSVLENRLSTLGYADYSLTMLKNSSSDNYDIRIELPNTSSAKADVEAIAAYGDLEIMDGDGNIIISGEEGVKSASPMNYTSADANGNEVIAYACNIQLTDDGYNALVKAIDDSENSSITLTIKLGEEEIFSSDGLTKDAIQSKAIFISGIQDQATANRMALQVNTGGLLYEYEVSDGLVSTPLMGEKAALTVILSTLIVLVIALVLYTIKYRGFGLIAFLSMLSFVLLEMLLLVAVPGVKISMFSVLGVLASLLIVMSGIFVATKKIFVEFNNGKTFKAAVDASYKKALFTYIDISVVLAIASLVLFLLAKGIVRSFAITFGIGVVIALFITVLLSKWLVKLFYNSITKKEAFFNVKREDNE